MAEVVPANAQEIPGVNVYEAARARIKHAMTVYDEIVVSCSGGKDSVAVLYLMCDIYKEMGIEKPVQMMFLNEELITSEVMNFVESLGKEPDINLMHMCVPLSSHSYLMGELQDYIQWDRDREHVWPLPEGAITEIPGHGLEEVFTQYTIGEHVARAFFPGKKVAYATGIRGDESMRRHMSVINAKTDPHIAYKDKFVGHLRPIYLLERGRRVPVVLRREASVLRDLR